MEQPLQASKLWEQNVGKSKHPTQSERRTVIEQYSF